MTCPHGMPKPSTCVDCMMDGPVVEPARWRQVGAPFAARYPQDQCAGCLDSIVEGMRVQRWDRADRTAYLHEECRP